MALTKVTGQVINNSTGLVVGVTTVGGGLSATDGFFSGIVTAVGDASFSGNVSVGGTLTYEDVTNIDAVGLVTARNGIVVGSGITLSKDGDGFFTGVVTATSYSGDGSSLTGIAATDNVRTGILDVAGVGTFRNDVNIPDKIIHLGDTNTAIRFPAADTITAETGGSERLRIDSSGRLLLGTTTEGYSGGDGLTLAASGSTGITIRTGTTSQGILAFSDGTSGADEYRGYVQYQHQNDAFAFGTNGTQRITIDSNGHVLPAANNTYNLGSSSNRWANLYVNDMHFSNEGKTNDVDGTWGDWTLQEGESDVYMINNRSGKKYKFNLTEVS